MENKKIHLECTRDELLTIYNCVSDKIKIFIEFNKMFNVSQIPEDLIKIENDINKILNNSNI